MIFKGARLLIQLSDIKFLLTSKAIVTRQFVSIIISIIQVGWMVIQKKKMPWRREILANKIDKGERISFFLEILILSEAIFYYSENLRGCYKG